MLRAGGGGRVARWRRDQTQYDEDGNKVRPKEVPDHLLYLIDREKIDVLRRHFEIFDEDSSGLISHDELADFMRSIGHNPVESRLRELISQVDTDNNGDLSFGEFVQLWYSYLSEAETEKLMIQKAFEFFDLDSSNSIDRAEFLEAMTTLGDPLTKEECSVFFNLVDHDHNGLIDFDEFVEFVCNEGPVYEDPDTEHPSAEPSVAPSANERQGQAESSAEDQLREISQGSICTTSLAAAAGTGIGLQSETSFPNRISSGAERSAAENPDIPSHSKVEASNDTPRGRQRQEDMPHLSVMSDDTSGANVKRGNHDLDMDPGPLPMQVPESPGEFTRLHKAKPESPDDQELAEIRGC